ncbi:MAG: hypothetical protein Q9220_003197 [cf. Caloplaca sp. 1 TL-2023]
MLDAIKDEKKASLAVADPKLASAINKLPQLSLQLISDASTADLYRSIRNHLSSLVPALIPERVNTMSLGLSHSLSRHKLKFSPDKVDTMIIQAIALLDDLDKELNIYAMRVKEWYGWHFPEMARIVNDNLAYARIIIAMGMRTNAASADLAEILPEEIETAVKAAAEVSMGTEITSEDLDNIRGLAEQVVSFTDERAQLSSYLSARMAAVAPNLTALVGDLVGARLIAHAGSLMNLAKSPASTIQILGAEKALFRALKTKHDTPKYGLIYHASLIGQATGKNKGKMARVLATKAALGLRVDALADWSAEGEGKGDIVPEEERAALGQENRLKLERRLAALEGKPLRSKGVAIAPNGILTQPGKWEVKEARKYNPDADGLAGDEPAATVASSKKLKKSKPEGLKQLIQEVDEDVEAGSSSKSTSRQEKDDAEEMENGLSSSASTVSPTKTSSSPSKKALETRTDDDKSETISIVSDDTVDSSSPPKQQETDWQSSIVGDSKEAKKARKKERHERKAALSEQEGAKKKAHDERIARRLDRQERRQKRHDQKERRQAREDEQYKIPAEKAGMSVKRYKRKLERGEITFDAGDTPMAISKKEKKAAEKAAEGAAAKAARKAAKKEAKKTNGVEETNGAEKSGKKRKRDGEVNGEDVAEKVEKKKKKKQRV